MEEKPVKEILVETTLENREKEIRRYIDEGYKRENIHILQVTPLSLMKTAGFDPMNLFLPYPCM